MFPLAGRIVSWKRGTFTLSTQSISRKSNLPPRRQEDETVRMKASVYAVLRIYDYPDEGERRMRLADFDTRAAAEQDRTARQEQAAANDVAGDCFIVVLLDRRPEPEPAPHCHRDHTRLGYGQACPACGEEGDAQSESGVRGP